MTQKERDSAERLLLSVHQSTTTSLVVHDWSLCLAHASTGAKRP